MNKIKYFLIKIDWFITSELGLNIFKFFKSLYRLNYYFFDLYKFKKKYTGNINLKPCLHDRFEEAGVTKNEYFWQDLYVARQIFENNPKKHIDIGSRIDGFVTHVASYREIEVYDIRKITTKIPGITFKQIDLMNFDNNCEDIKTDSLSCLHTLEHFGLGRYGDPIDINGYIKGIKNLTKLVKKNGLLYLSTPIGIKKVEFNANWIFNPKEIIENFKCEGFELDKFLIYNSENILPIFPSEVNIDNLSKLEYTLAIFIFKNTAI